MHFKLYNSEVKQRFKSETFVKYCMNGYHISFLKQLCRMYSSYKRGFVVNFELVTFKPS